jgi:hypothetical protein
LTLYAGVAFLITGQGPKDDSLHTIEATRQASIISVVQHDLDAAAAAAELLFSMACSSSSSIKAALRADDQSISVKLAGSGDIATPCFVG